MRERVYTFHGILTEVPLTSRVSGEKSQRRDRGERSNGKKDLGAFQVSIGNNVSARARAMCQKLIERVDLREIKLIIQARAHLCT